MTTAISPTRTARSARRISTIAFRGIAASNCTFVLSHAPRSSDTRRWSSPGGMSFSWLPRLACVMPSALRQSIMPRPASSAERIVGATKSPAMTISMASAGSISA
jgi:hypothetical protein